MPFIVRDMTDQEAVQAMRDSNKQRDQTLPSELAALLDLEVEAIKHQGSRTSGQIGAVDKVSQQPSRYVIMRKTT